MKSRFPIVLLCLVNALLAITCAALWLRPSDRQTSKADQAPIDDKTNQFLLPNLPVELGSLAESSPFSYLKLYSRDLKRYVRNLKSVKCPQETVQDIILAEINRAYSAREAALKLRSYQRNPWDPRPVGSKRDWEHYEQLIAMENEKVALIKDVLGIDVAPDVPPMVSSNANNNYELALSELPEAKRAGVRAAMEQFWAEAQRLQEKVNGLFLPEDADAYRKLRTDRVASLKSILSADEYEKFELRTSSTASNLGSRLAFFSPSEDEFKKIFDIQHDYNEDHTLPGRIVGGDPNAGQKDADTRAAMEKQIQDTLGPDRYAEYQRSQDGTYQQIARQTDQAGLPRDTAVQAYNLSKDTRANLNQIYQDATLTQQQKQDQAQVLIDTANSQFKDLVGETNWNSLKGMLPGLPRTRTRGAANPAPVEIFNEVISP